jgi:hypothetical protein
VLIKTRIARDRGKGIAASAKFFAFSAEPLESSLPWNILLRAPAMTQNPLPHDRGFRSMNNFSFSIA